MSGWLDRWRSSPPRTQRSTFSGGKHHEEVLSLSHAILRPETYLEIGVYKGRSLGLTLPGTFALGVDPDPRMHYPVSRRARVVKASSDSFFHALRGNGSRLDRVDLAFIDGMHLFEYALRDFRNVESLSRRTSVIIIDDCLPKGAREAQRTRETEVWSGDVWRLLVALYRYRPDLELTLVGSREGGLCIVTNPDPSSRVLFEEEDEILQTIGAMPFPGADSLGWELDRLSTLEDVKQFLVSKSPEPYRFKDRMGIVGRYVRLRYGDVASRSRQVLRRPQLIGGSRLRGSG